MANTTPKTNTRKAQTKSRSAQSKPQTTARKEEKPIVVKEVDPTQYVTVRNGFQGKLVYKSKKTGERFVWDGFGTEQEMELRELRNAKNSNKGFFINNWFMFDEDWIIDYLGVRQYYKNAIGIDEFDDVFNKGPDELKKIIQGLSNGQKESVAYRAKELIRDKKIDSLSVIAVLEEVLNIDLIEK